MSGPDVALSHQGGQWPEHGLVEAAELLLRSIDLGGAELSLVLCDDAVIQGLNQQWRGKDVPTDVLSFPQREGEDADADDPVLGDIVISVPCANRQADERGHDLGVELKVLLVHGLLHLLGYDHMTPDDSIEMGEAEERLLGRLLPDTRVALIRRASPAR